MPGNNVDTGELTVSKSYSPHVQYFKERADTMETMFRTPIPCRLTDWEGSWRVRSVELVWGNRLCMISARALLLALADAHLQDANSNEKTLITSHITIIPCTYCTIL